MPRRRASSNGPPPPPGFELDEPEDERNYTPVGLPSLAGDSIVSAVDGDTARLSSGRSLRIFGTDAPESKQLGWNRAGQAVPIGQQSKQGLSDMLGRGAAVLGAPRGQSYGRPVAPFTVAGQDAGQAMIRSGEAYAAPSYMKADPDRSRMYMAAERLARLNRLGVHQTYSQMPGDFRHNSEPAPDRETMAQFWDTPTPFAGMRPEDEKRYTDLLNTAKSPEEITSFAKTVGFDIDPNDAQRWVNERDKYRAQGRDLPAYAQYGQAPKALTNQGDGVTGATMRGVGAGTLAGGLDEAGALVDTLGLTDGRENLFNSDRRFADIWANNQEQNSSILGYDDLAHPYAQTAGELAGGLIAPFGAGAKTVPELFRVGAAYGGAAGFLGTDGELGQRAIGGAIGTGLGGVAGAGLGKALELAAPLARSAWARFSGRAGVGARGLADDAGQAVAPHMADDLPEPPPGFVLDESSPNGDSQPTMEAGRSSLDGTNVSLADNMPAPPPGFVLDGAEDVAPVRGNVRMWRSGDGANGGWFTSSREYAEQLARRDKAPLWYADVPRDHPAFAGAVDGQGPEQGFTFNHEFAPGELSANSATGMSEDVPTPPPGFVVQDDERSSAPMMMVDDSAPSISQEVRRPDYLFTDRLTSMDQPLTDAQRAVMAERIDPRDLTPIPSNEIGSVEEAAARDAGRYAPATAPNERGELTKQTVRAYNGAEVPKVGPSILWAGCACAVALPIRAANYRTWA